MSGDVTVLNALRFGQGHPLVLQHGFLGGAGYWLPTLAPLSRHFDVLAPDLPGFAGSAGLDTPNSIAGFAAALAAFLDRLEIARCDFVGHSMGGMIAQALAHDHSDRIRRLVLYGTSCRGAIPGRFETFAETAARLRREGLEPTRRRLTASWFKAGEQDPYFATCAAAGAGVTQSAAENALKAVDEWDFGDRLSRISAPTLVICGDSDRSCRVEESVLLWQGIPNAQLSIVPDCAHNVHLEKPSLFNQLLLEFFS